MLAADVGQTVSVAASDLSTKFNSTSLMAKDGYYTFSNLGSCVDIFAPGQLRPSPSLYCLPSFCKSMLSWRD